MRTTRLLRLVGTVTPSDPGETVDTFGDPVVEDGDPIIVRCWLEQTVRVEDTANRDQQAETYTLYLEAAAASTVDGSSRITIDGFTYELDGPPWAATNPRTGRVSHLVATGRRVT